jgi:CelD/BcsL family acetyltransferase involved in cellulose biosynthesis
MRHEWFATWARAFIRDDQVETPVLWEGGRMLGCLPAFRVGKDLQAMVNWETPLFAPIAADAMHTERVLQEAVARCGTALLIEGVEARGDAAVTIERSAASAGYKPLAHRWQTSPIIETRGTFEEYQERTRPQWLKRLARYRRKMSREMGLELTIAELPERPGAAFDECLRLEASGWKGQSGTAILSDPAMEAFYRDVFAMLLASGELKLSLLRLNGRLAAFDFAFVHGGRIYSVKTGFDESLKKVVPGLVLRLSLIEHCFEAGLSANELLGDDAPWKQDFATAMRENLSFRCYRSTPRGRAAYLTHAYARPVLGRLSRAVRTAALARGLSRRSAAGPAPPA